MSEKFKGIDQKKSIQSEKSPVVKQKEKVILKDAPKTKKREIGKSMKKMKSTIEIKENKERLTKKQIINNNVALTKEDVPKTELNRRIKAIKKENSKLSQTELEEKALDQMTNELGDKGKEALVKKRIKDYDRKETFKIKDKDGNEKEITETQFEHMQRNNPELKKMTDKLNPELSKELLAIYGEKKISGYADLLAKKGVTSLEEAEKAIQEETLKRAKEKIQTGKDGKPLPQAEKDKIASQIERNMKSDPKYASQMASKMAGSGGMSEAQASNVQPEALNLSGTVKDKTLNLIKHFEGFNSKAFWDYKQWTRGYGTKAPGGGATISKEKASTELEQKINTRYNLKKELSKRGLGNLYDKLGDNQVAALTSFIFNLGPGKLNNIKPQLRQFEQSGDPKVVANKMLNYNKAGGKVLSGLVKRRKTEAQLFTEGGKKSDNQNTKTPKVA